MEAPVSRIDGAMNSLLLQAEDLLIQVNTVRNYSNKKSAQHEPNNDGQLDTAITSGANCDSRSTVVTVLDSVIKSAGVSLHEISRLKSKLAEGQQIRAIKPIRGNRLDSDLDSAQAICGLNALYPVGSAQSEKIGNVNSGVNNPMFFSGAAPGDTKRDIRFDDSYPISSPGTGNTDLTIEREFNFRAPNSTLARLDWLIRGVPEAYDDEDTDMNGCTLDDLAIEKLIMEGGKPPSQLLFPSIHAMGQQIMDKLQGAKCLEVTFNHIFVYSARYGVRKHCSRLVIRSPRGCRSSGTESRSGSELESECVTLDLPELLGREQIRTRAGTRATDDAGTGTGTAHKLKVGARQMSRASAGPGVGVGVDAFFVGEMELQRTVRFPIDRISDVILKGWLRGGSEGINGENDRDRDCLRIELHGYISPPHKSVSVRPNARAEKAKAKTGSEMQVFGWVDVPLAGLLGTPGLDAIVTCELEATKNTLASVLSRQHLLPSAMRHTGQGPLGPKLGKLTCRLTIVCGDNPESISSSAAEMSKGIGRSAPSMARHEGDRDGRSVTAGEVKQSQTAHSPAVVSAPQSLLLLPTHPPLYDRASPPHVVANANVTSPTSSHGIRDPGSPSSSTKRGRDKHDRNGDTLHAAMDYVPSEARMHDRNRNQHQYEDESRLAHNIPSNRAKVHDEILFDKKGSDGTSDGVKNADAGGGTKAEGQEQRERGSGRDRNRCRGSDKDDDKEKGRAVMGVSCKSLFGLDVGALLPPDQLDTTEGKVVVCRVIIAYKTSRREREEIYGPWVKCEDSAVSTEQSFSTSFSTSQSESTTSRTAGMSCNDQDDDLEYVFDACRLQEVTLHGWTSPVFEVWAEWGVTSSPRHSSHGPKVTEDAAGGGREEEKGMVEEKDKVVVQCRSLLGLSRFPPNTLFDQMMGLVVVPICPRPGPGVSDIDSSCQQRSTETVLVAALHLGESWSRAATATAKSLSPYNALSKVTPGQPTGHMHAPENCQAYLPIPENVVAFDIQREEERKMTLQEMTMMEESDRCRGGDSGDGDNAKVKGGERARDVQNMRERESERDLGNSSQLIPNLPVSAPLLTPPPPPPPLGLPPTSHATDQRVARHALKNEGKGDYFHSAQDRPAPEIITTTSDGDLHGPSVAQVKNTAMYLSQGQGQGSYKGGVSGVSRTSCHILDVTIEGVASFLSAAGEELGMYGSLMGCFVVYSFPLLAVDVQKAQTENSQGGAIQCADIKRKKKISEVEVDVEVEEAEVVSHSQLWWDVECPVLNGRVRHVFELPSSFTSVPAPTPSSEETPLADTDRSIDYTNTRTAVKAAMNTIHTAINSTSNNSSSINRCDEGSILVDSRRDTSRDGILFHIYCSDPDGCLPPPGEREAVGTARLTASMLRDALSLSGTRTYSLPISFCNTDTKTPSESHSSSQVEYQHSTQHLTPDNSILLSLSHRLQPVLLHRSLDLSSAPSPSPSSSFPLAVIARAKSLRSTNTHNQHGNIGTSSTPDHSLSLDDGAPLTSYQKLQRGLFSWENRSHKGQSGKKAFAPIPATPNIERSEPTDSRTDAHVVHNTIDRSNDSLEKEGDCGTIGEAANHDKLSLRREKNRSMSGGAPVRVTVGKVTNLPMRLIPQYDAPLPPLPAMTSSSASSTPTSDPDPSVRAFLFCVVDPFDTSGDERGLLALSKYGNVRASSFTTSLQPIGRSRVLEWPGSGDDRAGRRDVVWGETADMSVWGKGKGKVFHTSDKGTDKDRDRDGDTDRNQGQAPLDLESKEKTRAKATEETEANVKARGDCLSLSMYRGAAITVSVYVRTQYVLPDHRGQQAVPASACMSTTSVLMTSDAGGLNMLHAGDQLVGRTVVDLTTLALGMVSVCGWYHFINAKHEVGGQVFLSVSLPGSSRKGGESVEGCDVGAVNEEEVEEEAGGEVENEEVQKEIIEPSGMEDEDEEEWNKNENWNSGGEESDMFLSTDGLMMSLEAVMEESDIGHVDPLDGNEVYRDLDDCEEDEKDDILKVLNDDDENDKENRDEDKEEEDDDEDENEGDRENHRLKSHESAQDSDVSREEAKEKEEVYEREECGGTDWDDASKERDALISLSSDHTYSSIHETGREEEVGREMSCIVEETLTEECALSHDSNKRVDTSHYQTSPRMHVMSDADHLVGRRSLSVRDHSTYDHYDDDEAQEESERDSDGGKGDCVDDGIDDDNLIPWPGEIGRIHEHEDSEDTLDIEQLQSEGQISRENAKEGEGEGEGDDEKIATHAVRGAEDTENITENEGENYEEEMKTIERKIEEEKKTEEAEEEEEVTGALCGAVDEISLVSIRMQCQNSSGATKDSSVASSTATSISTSSSTSSCPSNSSSFPFSASPTGLSVILDEDVANAIKDCLSLSCCEPLSHCDSPPRDTESPLDETVPRNLDNEDSNNSGGSKGDSSVQDGCSHSSIHSEHDVFAQTDSTQLDTPDESQQQDQSSLRTDDMNGQEGSSTGAAYSSDSDFDKSIETSNVDVDVGEVEVEGEGFEKVRGEDRGWSEALVDSASKQENEENKESVGGEINVEVDQISHNALMQFEAAQMQDSVGVEAEGEGAACTSLGCSTQCTQDSSMGSCSAQEQSLESAVSKVPVHHFDKELAPTANTVSSYRDDLESESARMRCLVQDEVERVMAKQFARQSLLSLPPSTSPTRTTACCASPPIQGSNFHPMATLGLSQSPLKVTVETDMKAVSREARVSIHTDTDIGMGRGYGDRDSAGQSRSVSNQLGAVSRPLGDVIASALSKVRRAKEREREKENSHTSDGDRDRVRFPGRQRQFLDLETERVAQIMLRTMARKDDAL